VQHNKFREDLYYRLSTVPIRVPSLASRKEDIVLLFRKFASDFADKYKTQSVQLEDDAKSLLLTYPWPGNVRELKNIAEQVSVLSEDKSISAKELERYLQPYPNNRLPMVVQNQATHEFQNEREILYKVVFDLKKDVNELKRMFVEIIQNPQVAEQHPELVNNLKELHSVPENYHSLVSPAVIAAPPSPQQHIPVIMDNNIQEPEEVEESLNIMDKEKELIIKALKKHKSKRKDAALDLGISERTLYRKLKEYDIEDL
jgi:DNA-binding NtrC family response regulator